MHLKIPIFKNFYKFNFPKIANNDPINKILRIDFTMLS